jgi:hypothetical protein
MRSKAPASSGLSSPEIGRSLTREPSRSLTIRDLRATGIFRVTLGLSFAAWRVRSPTIALRSIATVPVPQNPVRDTAAPAGLELVGEEANSSGPAEHRGAPTSRRISGP